jgi:3-polyprenyl-4-hydroxybenzoate decarboxylase
MHADLNAFIDDLAPCGWLRRVREPVSPDLEI